MLCHVQIMSATCLFLASKSGESPRKLYDVVHHYCVLRQKSGHKVPESERKDMPTTILLAERILLQTLCFDLQLDLPYRLCSLKIKLKLKSFIPDSIRKEFNQLTINFINDSYRTTLCLEQSSSVIASSALFFSALQLGIQPVQNTKSAIEHNWFELLEFDIDYDALQRICISVVEAIVQDSGENNPTPAGIAHGVSFKEKLETFSAMINKNVIHHPSPTTVATVPLQFVNTKMNNITSNTSIQREKDNVAYLNNHNYHEKEKERERETEEQIRQKQSKIYSIQHPPPVPSLSFPIESPSSLPSATPPPPPPDTPSSSYHYSMPDTPNYAPPGPPPDTPESCQSTPAPPPPPTPTPSEYIKADPHGYENQSDTPAPPAPPTPDNYFTIGKGGTGTNTIPINTNTSTNTPTQTQSAIKNNNAIGNFQRRPFQQLVPDIDSFQNCQQSPKKRRVE